MKNILIIGLLSFFSLGNAQTKSETINWINQKFSGDRTGFNNGYYSFVCFTKIDLNGNVVNTSYRRDRISGEDKDISTVNLKNLSYTSVYTRTDGGFIFFYARCENGKKCVKNNSIYDNYLSYMDDMLLGMIEENYAPDIEQRGIKAFKTAIRFFNNKKEAF
ncbi:hypothetical protein JSO59_007250 [Riemerella anatipestifer]|uniref:hypothetical protein n=1 Tax=Riemerella anatipestifer TaxID=34085 RepID=UPI0030BDFE2E